MHSWQDAAGAPNGAAVSALIRDTAAHVVSLVEVNEPWGAPSVVAEIAGDCGYAWTFVPCVELGTAPGRRGYGNALLTRVPVTATQQVSVFRPEGRYDGSEPSETRSLVLAAVHGPGVWVGSTHFPATHQSARKAATTALLDVLRELRTPWIVSGDFNDPPSALFTGRTDLLRCHPAAGEPTYPARRPKIAIDYFLTSPDVTMKAEVLHVSGSDHLPILGTARLA